MIKCPDQKELQRLVDGELTGRKVAQLEEHLRACEICAREVRELRRMGELVSGAIRKEAEGRDLSGLWTNVRQAIGTPAEQPKVWELIVNLLWKPAAKLAYAALIVLIAGFFVTNWLLSDGQPDMLRQAQVHSISSYSPEVTLSVVVPQGNYSAIVCITGLDAVKEN